MNRTDNVLTVTGLQRDVDLLRASVAGAEGVIDFDADLPGELFDEGEEPAWWARGAYNSRIVEATSGLLVYAFQTAWEAPLEWVEALSQDFPALSLRLLSGDEFGAWAGEWGVGPGGADCELHEGKDVGYPAVFRFVNARGWDFGWDTPEADGGTSPGEALYPLPALRSGVLHMPYTGPQRIGPGGLTWAEARIITRRAGVLALLRAIADEYPSLAQSILGVPAGEVAAALEGDTDPLLRRLTTDKRAQTLLVSEDVLVLMMRDRAASR